MGFAKYEVNNLIITKDGHVMFHDDIVKDLNRKSLLERERNNERAIKNTRATALENALRDVTEELEGEG